LELHAGGFGPFEHIVQEAGGNDFVWPTVALKQLADLDWVGDERRVVDLPGLTGVTRGTEREGSVRARQFCEPDGAAT
jgi:hypothetical protein